MMFCDTDKALTFCICSAVVVKTIKEIVKYQGKQRQLEMKKRKQVYRLPIVQKCYKCTKKRFAYKQRISSHYN